MNARQRKIAICILTLSLFISGCGPGQLFGPTKFVSIAAGDSHTCGLTSNGGVKCWGDNEYGQLGDGTTTTHTTPVDVIGLSSGVSAIAASGSHTCALMLSSGVKCWGGNGYGQLGDGTTADQFRPVDVSGLANGVKAIATGYNDTCALTVSGGVKCWGLNGYGQLGDGAITTTAPYSKNQPVDVIGLTDKVSAVAAGQDHTCVLIPSSQGVVSGGVKCWGYNEHGQLGDGTPTTTAPYVKTAPVDVSGLASGVRAITAGGGQTCALLLNDGVKCWGTNAYGELGDGTTINRATPANVTGLTHGVSAIAAGYQHTCALTVSGAVKCWGSFPWGDGKLPYTSTPVDIIGLANGISAIAAGHGHTCALTLSGGVKCWGFNAYGQLGDGTTTDSLIPVDVKG